MSAASQSGMPTPLHPLDIQNPDNQALLFSSAAGQSNSNTMRTRYTPVRFGVICLIDSIQREHAAKLQARSFQTWDEEDLSPMEIESLRERSDLMQRPAG